MSNAEFDTWFKLTALTNTKLRNAISTTALSGTIYALGFNRKSKRLLFIALMLTCLATVISLGGIRDSLMIRKKFSKELDFIKTSTFWFIVPFILLIIQIAIIVTMTVSLQKFYKR